MNLQAWIYAARKDSPEAVLSTLRTLSDGLEAQRLAGALTGYRGTALLTEADFDEKDIDPELVEPVTRGDLPAISLNITYDLDSQQPGGPQIEALLAEGGLEHVLTDPPAGH